MKVFAWPGAVLEKVKWWMRGSVAAMLVSNGARSVSGDITYVDGGLHVRA